MLLIIGTDFCGVSTQLNVSTQLEEVGMLMAFLEIFQILF